MKHKKKNGERNTMEGRDIISSLKRTKKFTKKVQMSEVSEVGQRLQQIL